MATFARKKLAHIQLANSLGDIYVPGSGVTALIHNIILHNTNTTAETVVLNYDDNSSDLQVFKQDLSANETVFLSFPGEGLVCINPSSIRGNTTTASKVTCTVTGSEETA